MTSTRGFARPPRRRRVRNVLQGVFSPASVSVPNRLPHPSVANVLSSTHPHRRALARPLHPPPPSRVHTREPSARDSSFETASVRARRRRRRRVIHPATRVEEKPHHGGSTLFAFARRARADAVRARGPRDERPADEDHRRVRPVRAPPRHPRPAQNLRGSVRAVPRRAGDGARTRVASRADRRFSCAHAAASSRRSNASRRSRASRRSVSSEKSPREVDARALRQASQKSSWEKPPASSRAPPPPPARRLARVPSPRLVVQPALRRVAQHLVRLGDSGERAGVRVGVDVRVGVLRRGPVRALELRLGRVLGDAEERVQVRRGLGGARGGASRAREAEAPAVARRRALTTRGRGGHAAARRRSGVEGARTRPRGRARRDATREEECARGESAAGAPNASRAFGRESRST